MKHRPTEPTPASRRLRADLVAEDFLVTTGVDGVFGYGQPMVDALHAVRRAIVDSWDDPGARSLDLPAVMSRATLDQSGYPALFPHLVGGVEVMPTDARSDLRTTGDYVLAPASCYPVYPLYRGRLPADGASVRVTGRCFRHEPSADPERLVSFQQLEFVRIGAPLTVAGWLEAGQERMAKIGQVLGLDVGTAVASDPFFGPSQRIRSAVQVNEGAKVELRAMVDDRADVAIASSNRHLDHLTGKFGIHLWDAGRAHSACVAFGLERIVFALATTYGTDNRDWPAGLRRTTGRETGP